MVSAMATKLCPVCKRLLDFRPIKAFDAYLPEGVRVPVIAKTAPLVTCPHCDAPGPRAAAPPDMPTAS
jgi:hypothetical protein